MLWLFWMSLKIMSYLSWPELPPNPGPEQPDLHLGRQAICPPDRKCPDFLWTAEKPDVYEIRERTTGSHFPRWHRQSGTKIRPVSVDHCLERFRLDGESLWNQTYCNKRLDYKRKWFTFCSDFGLLENVHSLDKNGCIESQIFRDIFYLVTESHLL